jgi:hypothetical protein
LCAEARRAKAEAPKKCSFFSRLSALGASQALGRVDCAATDLLVGPSSVNAVQPLGKKYFALLILTIRSMVCTSRLGKGRIAVVTKREAGCGGRDGDARRASPMRAAKACGPGLPTLRLSLRVISRATVARKPGHRGEHAISRKTIAQGMPDDLAEPVVTAACFFSCRRAMGEAFTRHSLRPLHFERDIRCKTRAYSAARMRTCVSSSGAH